MPGEMFLVFLKGSAQFVTEPEKLIKLFICIAKLSGIMYLIKCDHKIRCIVN